MGPHKQIDTSSFRRAVWIYIHSIFGVKYDDYDYKHLKKLLLQPLRNYIKIVCTCPEKITKKDYDSMMEEFTHSEKVILFWI
jgi:sestrin 1/3